MGEMHQVWQAYHRFLDAKIERSDRGDDIVDRLTARSERPIWQAMHDALRAYCHPENHPDGKVPIERFPPEMALECADLIAEMLTGQTPEVCRVLSRPGRRHLPSQIDDKRSAVSYIQACDAGLIDDPSPRRTIAYWFGSHERTPYRWLADPAFADTSPEDFLPDRAADDRANRITVLARKSGAHYQAFKKRRTPL